MVYATGNLGLLAVDEAHCISSWGGQPVNLAFSVSQAPACRSHMQCLEAACACRARLQASIQAARSAEAGVSEGAAHGIDCHSHKGGKLCPADDGLEHMALLIKARNASLLVAPMVGTELRPDGAKTSRE